MVPRLALLATLALAACTRAEVASAPAVPAPAPAAPASTFELLLTADVWGEHGPCG